MATTTVTAKVLADTSGFMSGLNKASKKMASFGSKATTAGRNLSAAVTLPLVLAAKAAVDAASSFELAQTKIAALSGSKNIFADLANSARELGSSTIFTATEVTDLQLNLKKLGKSKTEIIAIQESILGFSQALDTGLADSGEFVVQTMNRFSESLGEIGPTAEQAAYVTDLFAAAAANSAVDAEKLRAALNYVGSEAAAAGFRLDETTAIIALLADRGFDASRGGTALRRILAQLAKSGYNAEESISALFDSTASYSEELESFGLRGAGPKAALGGLRNEYSKLLSILQNSKGFLREARETMDGTLFAGLKRISSAATEAGIAFVAEFGEPLKNIFNNIAKAFISFSELPKGIKAIVVTFGALLAVMGPLILSVGLLTTAFAFLSETLLLNPLFAALAGLIALGTALSLLKDDTKAYDNALDKSIKSLEQYTGVTAGAMAATKMTSEEIADASMYHRMMTAQLEDEAYWLGKLEGLAGESTQTTRMWAGNAQRAADQAKVYADKLEELTRSASQFNKVNKDAPLGPFLPTEFLEELEETTQGIEVFEKKRVALLKQEYLADFKKEPKGMTGLIEAMDDILDILERRKEIFDDIINTPLPNIEPLLEGSYFVGENDPGGRKEGTFIEGEMSEDDLIQFGKDLKKDREKQKALFQDWADQIKQISLSIGNAIASTFYDAATGVKTFGESMRDNLLKPLGDVFKKVVALTIAFALLNVASGGAFGAGIAGVAEAALGGQQLGSFMMSGFGFEGTNKNLNLQGSLSGSDIALSARRGSTANQRIYG